jgi:hypothetical protein
MAKRISMKRTIVTAEVWVRISEDDYGSFGLEEGLNKIRKEIDEKPGVVFYILGVDLKILKNIVYTKDVLGQPSKEHWVLSWSRKEKMEARKR